MAEFENASWTKMIGVLIFVPGVGIPTFIAFCGLRARKAFKERFSR
jgi:hypothetical protein